ncbi:ABC transporter ATP-binding protein, partial [Streptococcus pyogenes]
MKEKSVFIRLWVYLKHYKATLFLAIFLKIMAAVANVLEPFVLGLVITELTKNLLDMANQVPGAGINYSYVSWVLVIYAIRALFYEFGA